MNAPASFICDDPAGALRPAFRRIRRITARSHSRSLHRGTNGLFSPPETGSDPRTFPAAWHRYHRSFLLRCRLREGRIAAVAQFELHTLRRLRSFFDDDAADGWYR